MRDSRSLKYILLISCAIAVIYPLANTYLIFPSFTEIVVKSTEDEAVRFAEHLVPMVLTEDGQLKDVLGMEDTIEMAHEHFGLERMKVFSEKGEVMYSTDLYDIGKQNREKYFRDVIAHGKVHTKVVKKNTRSLEGRVVSIDVVETYVPIRRDGRPIGAFEIYYDVTARLDALKAVLVRCAVISFGLMFGFFLFVVIVLLRTEGYASAFQASEVSQTFRSPVSPILIIAISLFVAESVVMFLISAFPPVSDLQEAFLDSAMLVMLVSPVLYFFLFRPMVHHIEERKRAQEELKKGHDELETRVKERTASLEWANIELEREVRERVRAEDNLEGLLREKELFISRLGHDLKTPLTPLVTLLPIIRRREKDEKLKELLDVNLANVSAMKELVIKTLKHAQASSPYQALDMMPIALGREVDSYIEKRQFLIEQKKLTVENKIASETVIQADRVELEELFYNLISNAIKYTPDSGTITIEAEEGESLVTVSVRDTGIGLTEEQCEKVFQEFYKVDESRHDLDSSGLGLSISRKIVEKHCGTIWAESRGEGHGTTIRFTMKRPVDTEVTNEQCSYDRGRR
jgi:signal transduction histidine kinase